MNERVLSPRNWLFLTFAVPPSGTQNCRRLSVSPAVLDIFSAQPKELSVPQPSFTHRIIYPSVCRLPISIQIQYNFRQSPISVQVTRQYIDWVQLQTVTHQCAGYPSVYRLSTTSVTHQCAGYPSVYSFSTTTITHQCTESVEVQTICELLISVQI